MKKKFKILLALISLSLTLGLMSNTYSRYVADTTGDLNVAFTSWKILVNNTDITSGKETSIDLVPIMEENQNVSPNTIAPSSTGYFDIEIDPTNAGTSFNYKVTLDVLNENMPDLVIKKYALLNNNYVIGDEIKMENLSNNYIDGTIDINPESTLEPFTIRVYFEWYEGENELMDDNADTEIGYLAANENTTLQIKATIQFEQKIDEKLS